MSEAHEHHHAHEHADQASNKEEAIALLSYMVDHNKHHITEIAEVKSLANEAACAKIDEAIGSLEKANKLLSEALEELK